MLYHFIYMQRIVLFSNIHVYVLNSSGFPYFCGYLLQNTQYEILNYKNAIAIIIIQVIILFNIVFVARCTFSLFS